MSKEQSQEYRGNGNHEWEAADITTGGQSTGRLRVPGGWLYRTITYRDERIHTNMVFVPMPAVVKHEV